MLKGTINSITAEGVTLGCTDGQTLTLPTAVFEGTPKVGLEVLLTAVVLGAEDSGQTQLAQALLNELLKE